MGSEDRPRPIYSSRADDPKLAESIDRFVIAVAERIDVLQDAEAKADLKSLGDLASALVLDSNAIGFEALSECAELVQTHCLAEDPEAARHQVLELTRIAQRIRLGHRGAV